MVTSAAIPHRAESDLWTDDLSTDEAEALIAKIAAEVTKRRLAIPAVMALEMHKPIFGYATGLGVVFAPFLGPILGVELYRDLNRLFRERGNVERLILEIERGASEAVGK